MKWLRSGILLVVLIATVKTAPAPFADEESLRLPKTSKPISYDLTLTTNVHNGEREFSGLVKIVIEIVEATDFITLHNRGLTIESVKLKNAAEAELDISFSEDKPKEFLIIEILTRPLDVGSRFTVEISYKGFLQGGTNGFYRSSYLVGSETRFLAATQFESTNARSAFVSYDEPEFKATFKLTIVHGSTFSAIANTIGQTVANNEETSTTTFEETPRMSTYLLAFIVSDFTYISNEVGLPSGETLHRIYARTSDVARTAFALDNSVKFLKELETYANYDYELPKMWSAAIPDFGAGAMENWGLITYKEQYLIGEETSHPRDVLEILKTVAHEIGHQFFGNLVTAKWWNQIWLNEGFATLFEYLLVENTYPELRLRDYFNVQKVQNALRVDALESTRAMLSDAETPSGISNLFDRIAYDKSGSVIRMFQNSVGDTIFRNSLSEYLNQKKHDSATSDDLFTAFESVIAQTIPLGFDFTRAFKSWETTKGFPLVYVRVNETTRLFTVTQQRYYALNEQRVQNDERSWYVPINFATANSPNFDDTTFTHWIEDGETTKTIPFPAQFDSNLQWFIFNKQQLGFYRVVYDIENWLKIIEVLNSDNFKQIHVLNRAQLVDDALNLALDGYLDFQIALSVLSYLSRETDYIPWRAVVTNLDRLDNILTGRPAHDEFKTFVKGMVRRLYVVYGLEERVGDTLMDKFAREVAIDWTCRMGDEKCLADTYSHLKEAIDLNTEIPDSLEITYICNGLKGPNRQAEFIALWTRLQNSDDQAKRLRYIDGLICSWDYQALWELLEATTGSSRNFRTHEKTRIFNNLYLKSSVGLNVTINFISQYFEDVADTFSKSALDSLIIAMSKRISIYEEQQQLTELLDKLADQLDAGTRDTAMKNIDDNKVFITTTSFAGIIFFLPEYLKFIDDVENQLRLPKSSIPKGYKIHIDARNVHTGALPFNGEIEIDALIVESTNYIMMHSKTQVIDELKVHYKNGLAEIPLLEYRLFPAADTLTIYFLEALPANTEIIVHIKYTTALPTFGSGFYRTSYIINGETRYLGTTQFQPAGARYTFPHYDEPGYKVPFDLKITHHPSFTAIANTFGTDETTADNMTLTTFETTPPMSSYLLAFVVSDFDYISNEENLPQGETLHRVWVRPDSVSKAWYALENSAKVLKALEDYVGFPFELPKVDSAAIPNKGGAMENWGMVTYWETAMIYEENYEDISHSLRLSGVDVIAHELGHQFFGDAVTCEWWDVTWLNEGFATLFEYHIPSILYPEWNSRHFFNIRKIHSAFRFDGRDATRSMTFPVSTLADISESFDTVGYDKSGSVLRMFQHVVGEPIFRASLKLYLETHNHQPVRSQDLIGAFKTTMTALGMTSFDFEAAFKTWELQAGFPLVHVSLTTSGQFNVTQQRYFTQKKETPTDTSSWYIPLNFATALNPNFNDTSITNFFVDGQSSYLFSAPPQFDSSQWFVFNKQQLGYYRVNYDFANWHALIVALNSDDYDKIHVLNRVQLVDDALTFAADGYLDYNTAFGILSYLVRETEYTPWYSTDRFISQLYTTFGPLNNDLNTFVRRLSSKFYDTFKVPSDNIIPNEEVYERYSRELALKLACNSGNDQCLMDVYVQEHLFAMHDRKIPAGIENSIFCNGLRGYDKQDEWVELWKKMSAGKYKSQLISGLGCTDDPILLKTYLESTLGAGNSVNYTLAERRNVLSAVLNSHSGLQAVISFFQDFELDITRSLSYSLENLLNIPARTVKTREQQNLFNDYLISLTHLDSEAFRRVTTLASDNLQLQLTQRNVELMNIIKKINEGSIAEDTTTAQATTPEPTTTQGLPQTQTSTQATTVNTPEVTTLITPVITNPSTTPGPTPTQAAPTTESTTLGAATVGIKFVTLFTSFLVAYTLKY